MWFRGSLLAFYSRAMPWRGMAIAMRNLSSTTRRRERVLRAPRRWCASCELSTLRPWEKNWTPFLWRSHLLLSYSLEPHRVVVCNTSAERSLVGCSVAFVSSSPAAWASGAGVRANSTAPRGPRGSSPAVRVCVRARAALCSPSPSHDPLLCAHPCCTETLAAREYPRHSTLLDSTWPDWSALDLNRFDLTPRRYQVSSGRYIGVCHFKGRSNIYMHAFYELEPHPPFTVLRTSPPFRFASSTSRFERIQFVASMYVQRASGTSGQAGESLVISYGVSDSTSRITSVRVDDALRMLEQGDLRRGGLRRADLRRADLRL